MHQHHMLLHTMCNTPTLYAALYNVKCTNITCCFVQCEMHQHHTLLCTMWNAPTSYTALYNVKCTNIIHCFVQYEMHKHHALLCTMWNTSTSHIAMYHAKCTNIIHDFVQCKMHQCETQHHTLLCTISLNQLILLSYMACLTCREMLANCLQQPEITRSRWISQAQQVCRWLHDHR